MSNHTTRIAGSDGAWQGRCSCKMRGPVCDHRWEAEDWCLSHLRIADRARAHPTRAPTLKEERDWYLKQAARAADEATKKMWEMLADGLTHRIGPEPKDDPLW